MNPLKELGEQGQSIWLDYIRRNLIRSGELKRMVEEDGIRGVTSNPTIFEKAIAGSTDYDDALAEMLRRRSQRRRRKTLRAAGHRRYSNGRRCVASGFRRHSWRRRLCQPGSVAAPRPRYAKNDQRSQTIARAVNRPNLMVKVPATPRRHSRHRGADRRQASTST